VDLFFDEDEVYGRTSFGRACIDKHVDTRNVSIIEAWLQNMRDFFYINSPHRRIDVSGQAGGNGIDRVYVQIDGQAANNSIVNPTIGQRGCETRSNLD